MTWWTLWLKRRGASVEHSELDARAPFFAVCVYIAALVLLKMLMWCFVFSGGFVRLPSQERKETQNARPHKDPTECIQKTQPPQPQTNRNKTSIAGTPKNHLQNELIREEKQSKQRLEKAKVRPNATQSIIRISLTIFKKLRITNLTLVVFIFILFISIWEADGSNWSHSKLTDQWPAIHIS